MVVRVSKRWRRRRKRRKRGGSGEKVRMALPPPLPPPPKPLPPLLSPHRPNPLFPRKKVEEKGGWGKRCLLPLFIIQEEEEEVNPGRLILSLLLHPATPFPKGRKNILQKRKKAREMKKNFVSSMVSCNYLKFEDSTVP